MLKPLLIEGMSNSQKHVNTPARAGRSRNSHAGLRRSRFMRAILPPHIPRPFGASVSPKSLAEVIDGIGVRRGSSPRREQRVHPKPGADRAPSTASFWTLRQEFRLVRRKNWFGRLEARNGDSRVASPAFAAPRRCTTALQVCLPENDSGKGENERAAGSEDAPDMAPNVFVPARMTGRARGIH